MKPFNLQAAMRGEPIVTRDGRKAKFVAYVPELADGYKVVAYVELRRSVISYYADGKYCGDQADDLDLFMYEPATMELAGIKFPEPLREPLEKGKEYWVPHIVYGTVMNSTWNGSLGDMKWLKRGLIQATEEGAQRQLKAMIKSIGGEYE